MTTALSMAHGVKSHLSLNVADLERSVAFYRVLFGAEPAKHHSDYAKFELEEPPVVFSLTPHPPAAGGSLSCLGLHVSGPEAVQAAHERLLAAGLAPQCQDGTVCGYARQNKCWVADPDGNYWEIYTVLEEVDPASVRRSLDGAAAPTLPAAGPAAWEHYLAAPPPQRIPHGDDSLDEVRLVGSFNADLPSKQLAHLIAEAFRVLKPGGKIVTHGLMADQPLPPGPLALPGLASLVRHVPTQQEPVEAFRAAGFASLQFSKMSENAWFRRGPAEMRECKLIGLKPPTAEGDVRFVLYKGPFREARDDSGNVYERGRRTAVSAAAWELLRQGTAAEQFVFLQSEAASDGCGCG